MATIVAPGSRRSVAPQITYTTPQTSQAQVVQQILQQMQSTQQPQTTVRSGTVQPRTGVPIQAGSQNGGISFGGTPGINGRDVSQFGGIVGTLGSLAGDADAANVGGVLGTIGNVASARTPQDAAMAAAPAIGSMLGAPGSLVSAGLGVATGDISRTVNALLSGIPSLGMVNALAGMFGLGTVGSVVRDQVQNYRLGQSVNPNAGILDSRELGAAINADNDPIGALINALSPAQDNFSDAEGYSVGAGLQGYGVTGGQGTRNDGGYGGGIGQSGGNAAGVGSNQA